MGKLVLAIVALLIVAGAFSYRLNRRLKEENNEERAIGTLRRILFPGETSEEECEAVVSDIVNMTRKRLSRDEALDYYLKIKGLQLMDLNTMNDVSVRHYLMKPTKARLHHSELVPFYEKYLNLVPTKGQSAV